MKVDITNLSRTLLIHLKRQEEREEKEEDWRKEQQGKKPEQKQRHVAEEFP